MKVLFGFILTIGLLQTSAGHAQVRIFSAEQSSWGYQVPLPYNQLSPWEQDWLNHREKLPLRSIGTVKVQSAPFRATAFYLGQFNGIYMFGVAAHVAILNDEQKPFAIELGHLDGSKFDIPI